jgi:hypothetical protein
MSDLFSETSRQFGLAVGLLVVGIVTLSRVVYVLYRDQQMKADKAMAEKDVRIKELEAETVVLRERLIEAIGAAEVGDRAAKRLAGGGRRLPGGR